MHDAFKGRDLLTLADLTPAEFVHVLDVAEAQKAAWVDGDREAPLAGRSVAIIMQKPSVRTRVSFEVASVRLGAHPVVMTGNESALSRGETVHDTAKVLERYCDAIVVRTYAQSLVEQLASHASVPVVNALTDEHHPCQGLADFLTVREKLGRLEGVRFAYVGDGNNMAHTYLLAGALSGMSVVIGSPAGFEPDPAIVEQARTIAQGTDATIELTDDPRAAVDAADVVVTDTWASMGQEDQHDSRLSAFESFRVDSALMRLADPAAIFMHCLPAHRGEEVTDEVIDAPYSVVFDEAENRLHVQKALLSLIVA